MKLETQRLVLRPLQKTDLPRMIDYATKPEFYQYLPIENQTEETIRTFFKERMKDQKNGSATRHTYAVALKQTDHIIGTIRLEIINKEKRIADIGYAMDLSYQGKGLMSEAVHQIVQHAFSTLGISTIWASVLKINVKSWKLLERIGMQRSAASPLKSDLSEGGREDEYQYVLHCEGSR
ncbi:MAG: GNAT family N-acetyltransferase [Sneathiella sp.]|nr:GNAT family N-acetyltransferase [Sneathiella sp.]